MARRLFAISHVACGLVGAAYLSGCADRCVDDGLRQRACPVDSGGGNEGGSWTTWPNVTATSTAGGSQGVTSLGLSGDGGSGGGDETMLGATETGLGIGDVTGDRDSDLSSGNDGSTAASTDTVVTDGLGDASGTTSAATLTETDTETATDTVAGTAGALDDAGSTGAVGTTSFCRDLDSDGFGDPDVCSADATPGFVSLENGADCDDTAETTFPGAAPLDDPDACMADADGDGYGDNRPPAGVTPGSDCNDLNAGVQRCALVVTEDGTGDLPYDEPLLDALASLGFEVHLIEDVLATAGDALGMTVVVISESALSTEVSPSFRTAPVPLLVLEGYVWDELGMAPQGVSVPAAAVEIVEPSHPLAAERSGNVFVIGGAGAGLFHTDVPETATTIAARQGDSDGVVLFAYDAGTPMLGGFEAPARRVGFGLDGDRGGQAGNAVMTAAGQDLFEAALTWLVSR